MILTAASGTFVPRSVVRKTGGVARPGLESRVVYISGDMSQEHCLDTPAKGSCMETLEAVPLSSFHR